MESVTAPTDQEVALEAVKALYGPMAYSEDHLTFRLVGYYTRNYQCMQAIGPTWEIAIERLKEKSTSPRRIAGKSRWPWRSTLITR